jgi:hypothetical protein
MPVSVSFADICSVKRSADGVVMHFGQIGPAIGSPGAQGVSLQHRVVLGEEGAAQLQDFLKALLEDSPPATDGKA